MGRVILENEDLRGQTISNPGPFLYVGGCALGMTQFVGDCTAADYINCDGPADWSRADTYASYWRGHKNMEGSKFPAKIGYLHHDPVGTIIREGAQQFEPRIRGVLERVGSFVLSDYVLASWDASPPLWWDGATARERSERVDAWRKVFEPYPQLARRFEELLKDLEAGTASFTPMPLSREVEFPDAKVGLDALNLPSLPREQDRHELARYVVGEAGKVVVRERHAFCITAIPPVILPMPTKDFWREQRIGGL